MLPYILMKKINLAKELLTSGIAPQDACERCGFSTYSNFYKAFVERTGISPKNIVNRKLQIRVIRSRTGTFP